MKIANFLMAGLLMASAGSVMAQAPAGAPAGANGICKDGTYSMSATKSGACGGHKGVQTWYAAAPAKAAAVPAAAPAAKPAPAAVAKPAPAAAPAPAPAAAKPAAPMAMPMPAKPAAAAAAPAAKTGPLSEKAAAPGGGPGMVWVNTDSKVYHCTGSAYYGKTKAGKYMSEADAKAMGARPNANKPCSK